LLTPWTSRRKGEALLDAMIYDFDGVVVDSEPVHLMCFREALSPLGVELTVEDYYSKYLGFDDHDCFAAALQDHGVAFSEELIAELTAQKTVLVKQAFARSIQPLPGAVELIRCAFNAGIPLGMCSGALREEIHIAARTLGILESFAAIVTAEDVRRSKPDPEGYVLALRKLSEATGRPLVGDRTVVVEDTAAGVESAKAAGMRVLAVTNSCPAGTLARADRIVDSLTEIGLEELRAMSD